MRECIGCHESKPLDTFRFRADKETHAGRCKDCERRGDRERGRALRYAMNRNTGWKDSDE